VQIIEKFRAECELPLVLPTTTKSSVPNITYGFMKEYGMVAEWKIRYLASDWDLGIDVNTGEPIIFHKYNYLGDVCTFIAK
jgi:hypothetical protein